MTTEPQSILDRVAAGELTADEAAGMLAAAQAAGTSATRGAASRRLHVRVTDLGTGRSKVNLNLPLAWVEAGLKVGAKYSPEVEGLDVREIIRMLKDDDEGRLIEVEDLDEQERVEIYVD